MLALTRFNTRRIATVGLACLAVLTAGAAWKRLQDAGAPGPVVLISIDTLRADRLPLHGYGPGRTPALDALARDGTVFDKAYAHAPQTLPSHASMFTGLLPFEHGVRDNLGFRLADGAVTIASLLRGASYRTGAFVSAYVLRPETGLAQGFETYDAELPPSPVNRSPGQVQRGGQQTLEATRRWLDSLDSSTFFLFFHLYEPHAPYEPPTTYRSMDAYDGEVAYADEIVGLLIEDLKRRGWYDDALIVATSDHGEGLGDHGELEHGLFLYDEVIRVPLIVKRPAAASPGGRVSAPVQHIDLLPTIAAAAAVQVPDGRPGRDLHSALETGALTPQGVYSEALYSRYHFGWSELQALTDDRYRYIKGPRPELYDLERDPDERTNLIDTRPGPAAALRAGLDALVGGRAVDRQATVTAEDRARLAALGYIGQYSAPAAAPGTSLPDPKDKVHILRQYREAVDSIASGDLADGARLLAAVVESEPQMSDAWSQYAAALLRMGRLDEASRAYQQLVRLNPDDPGGPLGAASALRALNRLDEARDHAELAMRTAPAESRLELARIAIAQQRYDEALGHAREAARVDPGSPLPLFVEGLVRHAQGRYADALSPLIEARNAYFGRIIQPSDLHFALGDSLARLERYAEAEQHLREELRLYPRSVRARAGLAMLYQATGRAADATREIDRMLDAVGTPTAYEAAGQLAEMFGDARRAAAIRVAARNKFH